MPSVIPISADKRTLREFLLPNINAQSLSLLHSEPQKSSAQISFKRFRHTARENLIPGKYYNNTARMCKGKYRLFHSASFCAHTIVLLIYYNFPVTTLRRTMPNQKSLLFQLFNIDFYIAAGNSYFFS